MGYYDGDDIIPNDSLKVIGKAFLPKQDHIMNAPVGTIVETSEAYKLLWLLAYPMLNDKATIKFDTDQGYDRQPISVVVDAKALRREFHIGEITYMGREAELTFFAVPAFFATLLVGEPSKQNAALS